MKLVIQSCLLKKKDSDGKSYSPVKYRLAIYTTDASGNKTYESGAVDTITTDETGKFTICGLDSSSYWMEEVEAPEGYNKLKDPVLVKIEYNSQTGVVTIKKQNTPTSEIEIKNNYGTELPATGGIGTTIFYVAGSILLIGAAVLLIVKKRMSDEK